MNNIFFEPYKDTFDSSIPFSKITADMYEPAVDRGIDKALAEVEAISNNPEPADMENTIRALDRAGEDLDRVLMAFEPLTSAMSSDEMMEIDMRISPKLTRFSLAIAMNERLWKRVKDVYDMRHTLDLDSEDRMLLENRYFGFIRNGALLEGADRERFKDIASEISELTTKFGNNVLSELNATTVDISCTEASGISDDLIDNARKKSTEEGALRFGLDQPTYMAVMKSADLESVRKKFYLAYCGRNIGGDFDNLGVLSRIAVLRRESAALLGFDNAASMIVERNMAHTPGNVMKLLNELREAYSGPLKQELAELKEFAGRELNPWDYSYFANKLRQERYNLDEEELRPYLPLNRVVDAMLALAGKLYGISFKETDRVEKYHPDVRVFEVCDSDDSYIGLLYMDFFTRESKRPGAWMTEFRSQRHEPDGTDVRPHITIVTNFAPPAGDKPALLRPREVETLLHEFGHSLHGLLSKCRYASTSGTNVRRDFVELPSQMNEGFATRKEFLETAGFHYATG
ncbi:MAG: M3 family metallopeptidase, partial [Muribaculaceae bacterium]|nr:M3 family metallopeptidase [Muribaculaceae bacterium]